MGAQVMFSQPWIWIVLACAVAFFASRRLRRWILGPPPGFTITLARPTTQEGETLQVSTTAPIGSSGEEIGEIVEVMAQGIDYRRNTWNEFVLRQDLESKHVIWKDIKAKMDMGAKLSNEERNWWNKFHLSFNEDGPVVARATKEKAHGEKEEQSPG